MNTKIHTYNELYTASINLYADGSCNVPYLAKYRTRDTINKMACYDKDTTWDLVQQLYAETVDISFPPGSNLYVSSECKTGRDTFRNSGYSIKKDKDKANAIVVPDVRADYYHSMACNIVARDEKDGLILIDIEKPGYRTSQLTDQDLANVRKYLTETKKWTPDDVQRIDIKVWFIPKCDELVEAMTVAKRCVPYIQESKVPINPSTQISPETLVFWENIEDKNLLVRTICTSDWSYYPVTLLAFLVHFKNDENWYNWANNDFRRILKSIGYEYYYHSESLFNDGLRISPKDYEMLQSYLFYKNGVDEKGGFMKSKMSDGIPKALNTLLMRAVAYKPTTIPNTMKLGDIRALVK